MAEREATPPRPLAERPAVSKSCIHALTDTDSGYVSIGLDTWAFECGFGVVHAYMRCDPSRLSAEVRRKIVDAAVVDIRLGFERRVAPCGDLTVVLHTVPCFLTLVDMQMLAEAVPLTCKEVRIVEHRPSTAIDCDGVRAHSIGIVMSRVKGRSLRFSRGANVVNGAAGALLLCMRRSGLINDLDWQCVVDAIFLRDELASVFVRG